jgi:hypothetical protein
LILNIKMIFLRYQAFRVWSLHHRGKQEVVVTANITKE